jgi:hypothetical protein
VRYIDPVCGIVTLSFTDIDFYYIEMYTVSNYQLSISTAGDLFIGMAVNDGMFIIGM